MSRRNVIMKQFHNGEGHRRTGAGGGGGGGSSHRRRTTSKSNHKPPDEVTLNIMMQMMKGQGPAISTPLNNNNKKKMPGKRQSIKDRILSAPSEKKSEKKTGHKIIPKIPIDILDELSTRFIINIPDEERHPVRILFQIELAHWFYVDFKCADNEKLPKLNLDNFAETMFKHIPSLRRHHKFEEVYEKWKDYKRKTPTYGVIILDEELENVLLVQGYWAKSSWGFPKGKVNEQEDPMVCACRETKEETGFDCTGLLRKKDSIVKRVGDNTVTLYIVHGVSKDTVFKPETIGEIRNIEWFSLKELPSDRNDHKTQNHLKLAPNYFFMTIPFIEDLKKWVSKRVNRLRKQRGMVLQSQMHPSQDHGMVLEPEVKLRVLPPSLQPPPPPVELAGNIETGKLKLKLDTKAIFEKTVKQLEAQGLFRDNPTFLNFLRTIY